MKADAVDAVAIGPAVFRFHLNLAQQFKLFVFWNGEGVKALSGHADKDSNISQQLLFPQGEWMVFPEVALVVQQGVLQHQPNLDYFFAVHSVLGQELFRLGKRKVNIMVCQLAHIAIIKKDFIDIRFLTSVV